MWPTHMLLLSGGPGLLHPWRFTQQQSRWRGLPPLIWPASFLSCQYSRSLLKHISNAEISWGSFLFMIPTTNKQQFCHSEQGTYERNLQAPLSLLTSLYCSVVLYVLIGQYLVQTWKCSLKLTLFLFKCFVEMRYYDVYGRLTDIYQCDTRQCQEQPNLFTHAQNTFMLQSLWSYLWCCRANHLRVTPNSFNASCQVTSSFSKLDLFPRQL